VLTDAVIQATAEEGCEPEVFVPWTAESHHQYVAGYKIFQPDGASDPGWAKLQSMMQPTVHSLESIRLHNKMDKERKQPGSALMDPSRTKQTRVTNSAIWSDDEQSKLIQAITSPLNNRVLADITIINHILIHYDHLGRA